MENSDFDLKGELAKLHQKILELAEENVKMKIKLDKVTAQLEVQESRKRKVKPTCK